MKGVESDVGDKLRPRATVTTQLRLVSFMASPGSTVFTKTDNRQVFVIAFSMLLISMKGEVPASIIPPTPS